MIQVKKNSLSRKLVEEPLQLTKVNSGNSLCDIAKEIYQVAKNGIEGEFASELEKVTASIFATLLVTRALDLSVGDENNQAEKKLDEALKLQFYSHLNGCFNSKQCSISTIVKMVQNMQTNLSKKWITHTRMSLPNTTDLKLQ